MVFIFITLLSANPMHMETAAESACLCRYLHELAEEKEISPEELSRTTGISPEKIRSILYGTHDPTITEIVSIGNVLGIKLTFQRSFSFAHQKIVNRMEGLAAAS
jgi:DNA-binding phage protein